MNDKTQGRLSISRNKNPGLGIQKRFAGPTDDITQGSNPGGEAPSNNVKTTALKQPLLK
jgi:hypothetical protein